jgi:hypothetical protein
MGLLEVWICFFNYLECSYSSMCNTYLQGSGTLLVHFVGLAYQGKDIVFRLIIEYSSLMDFGP